MRNRVAGPDGDCQGLAGGHTYHECDACEDRTGGAANGSGSDRGDQDVVSGRPGIDWDILGGVASDGQECWWRCRPKTINGD